MFQIRWGIWQWFKKFLIKYFPILFYLLSATAFNSVKDRFRAKFTLVGVGLTLLGAAIAVFKGKHDKKLGHDHVGDAIMERAEYSQTHRELAKNMQKH